MFNNSGLFENLKVKASLSACNILNNAPPNDLHAFHMIYGLGEAKYKLFSTLRYLASLRIPDQQAPKVGY